MLKRLVQPLWRRRHLGLWRAGCCLLTSAARTRARIYPSDKPSDCGAAGPRQTIGRNHSTAPTSLYRGPTRREGSGDGPRVHPFETR